MRCSKTQRLNFSKPSEFLKRLRIVSATLDASSKNSVNGHQCTVMTIIDFIFNYPVDCAAFTGFALAWLAYTWFADHKSRNCRSITQIIHVHREIWMRRMLERENRIVDSTLIGNLMRSVAFLASTTIIIIGGLLAALGATEQTMTLTANLTFIASTSHVMWELKLLLLLFIFVHAFFKFTWSLRQFNYCNILMGAAPLTFSQAEEIDAYARRAAQLNYLAGSQFNYGLRAYYFGLAVLSWFLSPWLFMVASVWVVVVLYWREFASNTLEVLTSPEVCRPKDDNEVNYVKSSRSVLER